MHATYDHAFCCDAVYNDVDSTGRAGSLESEIVEALARLDRQGILRRSVFDRGTHEATAGRDFIPVPIAQIRDEENLTVWPEPLPGGDYQPQVWMEQRSGLSGQDHREGIKHRSGKLAAPNVQSLPGNEREDETNAISDETDLH